MNEPAIVVDKISKLYRVAGAATRADNFREALVAAAAAPFRRFRELGGAGSGAEDFWALKDVSFEVQPGEVMGIVGRNGAGKSTLLKVLSRIVEPTSGRATLRGRVASLLEVGTGFHPELTGRENIYLNGSILGMRRREIESKFEEIVEFAEISKFLDTPVKRYSSGMYVRLAFAVAAHLEPEILIVDEVLAVGDAEFQKRCLGKMQQVAEEGNRTVLFVSHNMAAVRSLCSRAVLLHQGQLEFEGSAEEVVSRYLLPLSTATSPVLAFDKPRGAPLWMKSAALLVDSSPASTALMGAKLQIRICFESESGIRHPRFGWVLQTAAGEKILNSNNRYQPSPTFDPPTTDGIIECDMGSPPLMPGRYTLSFWLGDIGHDHHVELEALLFEVTERDLWGQGQLPPPVSPLWWPTRYSFTVPLAETVA